MTTQRFTYTPRGSYVGKPGHPGFRMVGRVPASTLLPLAPRKPLTLTLSDGTTVAGVTDEDEIRVVILDAAARGLSVTDMK